MRFKLQLRPLAADPPMRSAKVVCPCSPVSTLSPGAQSAFGTVAGMSVEPPPPQLSSTIDDNAIAASADARAIRLNFMVPPCVVLLASHRALGFMQTPAWNASVDHRGCMLHSRPAKRY